MPFTVKTQDDIINDILLTILNNIATLNDANIGSVFRQHVEALGIEIKALYDSLETIYEGTRISTATSTDLDELGLLVGKTRNPGTQATGLVTFKRISPAGSDFTIVTSVVISTQPNTGSEQLRYSVSSSVIFLSAIIGENHTFVDGNYLYALGERFVYNTSSAAITGYSTSTSLVYTFNNGTEYLISSINDFVVDVGSIGSVDDCDSTSGWSESTDATTITTSAIKKQGTASLNLGKSGTASNEAYYDKTLGASADGTDKWFVLYIRTEDTATRDLINRIEVIAGSGGSAADSYTFKILRSNISSDNWGRYRFRYNDSTTIVAGSPVISDINFIRFKIITNNNSDVITAGNVKMDYLIFSDTESYEGDVVEWLETTSPITNTVFAVDYVPLSKEVPVISSTVGNKFNVNKGKITYKVTDIPNINSVYNYSATSGGVDLESDDLFRERIKTAAQSQGKATAAAIRSAVLEVAGITSCIVDDLPEIHTTSETHTFFTGQSIYQLSHEVIYHNATTPTNIIITGTASATTHTFLYGTDYLSITNSDGVLLSQIQWQTAGTSPDASTDFNVDYYYNWLGHANVIIASSGGTPSTSLVALATEAAEATKAAGVTLHIISPTTIYVSVDIDILPSSGYTLAQVEEGVNDAIYNYLNTRGVSDDVYLAAIYDVVMEVTGVKNANITTPTSDITITTSEIVKPGTITISEM